MTYPTQKVAGEQVTAEDFNDFTLNPAYTYGETITAGQALYLKAADGKVWKASAATQAHVDAFVGIALVSGVANDENPILAPGKIVQGLSGLTAGSNVYLSDTAGALSTTQGTIPLVVGLAISTTEMLIDKDNQRVNSNVFGDGSDGALALDGTNTYGTLFSKSGATYTALRNIFATNIVFSGSAILDTGGYRIYANGVVSGTGTVRNNGANGTTGGNSNTSDGGTRGAGGAAGTPTPGYTVPAPAASGDGGQSDYDTGPASGQNGSSATLGPNSNPGADGGRGANAGGGYLSNKGAAGTVTTSIKWLPKSTIEVSDWFHFSGGTVVALQVAPGSGGGGGGQVPGGAGTPSGGGGGGAGAPGGFLFFAANAITGTIAFQANGGNGGAGGQGLNGTNRTGGGGGGAGNGGYIFVMYRYSAGLFTTSVVAGSAGAGGVASGGSTNTNGEIGQSGYAGTVTTLQVA